jgi:murein DD-endopeptidase MepM/ murein hydrolase activator NlpD
MPNDLAGKSGFEAGARGGGAPDCDVSWSDVGVGVRRRERIPPALSDAPEPPRLLDLDGSPRVQYERTYVLVHPGADKAFMLRLMDLIGSIGDRWTVGGSADDAGIGDLDVRRVIALRPEEWPASDGAANLEEFFARFYPQVVYWPLDWDSDYQLAGRLLACSLAEAGFCLAYPTTHSPPRITDVFGRWRPAAGVHHCGLDLAGSWYFWGDEIVSATDGLVVEAGWHGNQGGFGYRVRVKATAPDGREVMIRYAHLRGGDGVYVGIGDRVAVGQRLGRAGSTGQSTGDHLHIDVKVGDRYADPAVLIEWPDGGVAAAAAKSRVDVHSKLGIHVQRPLGVQELLSARPAVVKLVGNWDSALEIPEGALVSGATPAEYSADDQRRSGLAPCEAAAQFVSSMRPNYEANPGIAYWEGHAGVACDSEDAMSWYARFEIERVRLMAELGLKCVIGNFCSDAPPLELWPAFLPAIEVGMRHEALLGLQEYGWPWTWRLIGAQRPNATGDGGDEGWAALRYRQIYRQVLLPAGLRIPLLISECGVRPQIDRNPTGVQAGPWRDRDSEPERDEYIFRQLIWLDSELRKDDYVVGAAISAWGNWGGRWRDLDIAGTPLAGKLVAYLREHCAEPFRYSRYATGSGKMVRSDAGVSGSYRRTRGLVGVLLPPVQDTVERLDWRIAAAIGSSGQMRAVGHAVDPADREVVAVNPAEWGQDLRAWYDEHYPDIRYGEIETQSPWEMAVRLMPPLRGDIALAQTDPRWADYDFGEHPGGNGETIRNYGCFLTGLAIVLRKVYRRDVTPPLLDKLLVAGRAAYFNDNYLAWEGAVSLFPALDDGIKDDRRRSARELAQMLADGWEVILRRADGGHFVYLEDVAGDALHVIDTWDGDRKRKTASGYAGVRAVRVNGRGASSGSAVPFAGGLPGPGSAPGSFRLTDVLLPQIEDTVERLDWRVAAAVGASAQMWTAGHAADAGDGEVVAVNPGAWGGDEEPSAGAQAGDAAPRVIETQSPWEMAIKLVPPLGGDIALAQTDPRWANYDFGEHPDDPAGGETIGGYGCFLTGLAIVLRRVYQRDVTPPLLDKLLVAGRAAYFNDNYLAWEGAVSLFPAFDDSIKDDRRRSARELERLLRSGWEVILRRADGGHFVYLEEVVGDVLHVVDTWDGKRKEKTAADYAGVRAAHIRYSGGPVPARPILVGLHDRTGAEWMIEQGMEGCCVLHRMVQRQPARIDCRPLQDAGISVICRLNWGYADGTGTLPRPEQKGAFVDAVAQTILDSQGVEAFHVGNEPNNRQEWPGFGTRREFPLTADYVVEIYNEVWRRVAGRARMGPPPLDPYFGPGSNNREWWLRILDGIAGADLLFLHAKTQTNDAAEVRSRQRFTDAPLTWQYLHLRTVETALAVVPDRFRSLPVFVTELNPQHLERIGGATGWRSDSAAWVRAALGYFREEQPVAGVAFYRFESAGDQAGFALANKPAILGAIREASRP